MDGIIHPLPETKPKFDWTYWATHFIWLAIVTGMWLFWRSEDRATRKQVGEIREYAKIVLAQSEILTMSPIPEVRRAAEDLRSGAELLSREVEKLEEELTPSRPEPGRVDPRQ